MRSDSSTRCPGKTAEYADGALAGKRGGGRRHRGRVDSSAHDDRRPLDVGQPPPDGRAQCVPDDFGRFVRSDVERLLEARPPVRRRADPAPVDREIRAAEGPLCTVEQRPIDCGHVAHEPMHEARPGRGRASSVRAGAARHCPSRHRVFRRRADVRGPAPELVGDDKGRAALLIPEDEEEEAAQTAEQCISRTVGSRRGRRAPAAQTSTPARGQSARGRRDGPRSRRPRRPVAAAVVELGAGTGRLPGAFAIAAVDAPGRSADCREVCSGGGDEELRARRAAHGRRRGQGGGGSLRFRPRRARRSRDRARRR